MVNINKLALSLSLSRPTSLLTLKTHQHQGMFSSRKQHAKALNTAYTY